MIEVLEAGPLTTVQDVGRFGRAHVGVSPAGPVDWMSHALANRLVGNPETVAALEFTLHGPTLRCASALTMAVVGAPSTVDGVPMPATFRVRAGQTVRIGQCPAARGYIAVAGGIPGDEVLGSRSTDTMGGLGPAPLRAGDRLSTVDPVGEPLRLDPAVLPDRGGIVRVVPGPRDDWFTVASRREFFGKPYTAGPDSDRSGVRLTGPRLIRSRPGELPTEGMVTGAVQVPPSGEPIVLLAGHGPTGGYPVIGVVIRADLPTVGQLLPGRGIRFTPVTVEQARTAYRELRVAIARAIS
jgi:biotin-dependent carboxylase-like uncharacterized protein